MSAQPATSASGGDFRRFRDFLEGASGISLSEDKGYLVTSRLSSLMRELGCNTLGSLVDLAEGQRGAVATRDLRGRIVDAMTTNETLWFRDEHPFTLLKESLLPELAASGHRLRIWSAACSSGQEPYSISMVVEELRRERPGLLRAEVDVISTDVSSRVLQTAREAVYPEHVLRRGLSEARRRNFFEPCEGGWRVRSEVRARVQFRELNLLDSFALLGRFDLIFCRNVLIYFTTTRRADILARMAQCLVPRGWLLLGGTESVPAGIGGFEMNRLPRGLVYRRV